MIPSHPYCSTCGAFNPADRGVCFACNRPLQPGESAVLLRNRYRLLTQVGKGGFGAVHRAEDTQSDGRIIAIKQINLRGLTPQETIEATDGFNREVSLLSHLTHPSLPHIYDSFTDPEHWYLVMDFIEGETLETYLDTLYTRGTHTLPLAEVLDIGMQLCTVLDYLHTREPSIIFRDLKPSNIMRTRAGKLYLIDFGIARHFKPGKLKDTIPFGSPGYAAPEQYGKAQTTPRADIYSLGALLHMLLSGDDPVDKPLSFSPLRLYGACSLSEFEALVMRMVEVDVSKRPKNANDVKAELQRIADLQDGSRIWRPPLGQIPPPLAGASSAVQQQTSAYKSGQQQLYRPPAQRIRNSRRKFVLGGLAVTATIILGTNGIGNILSSLHPAINTGSPQNTAPSLFPEAFNYTTGTDSIRDITWSPDSKSVAWTSSDKTVQVWNAMWGSAGNLDRVSSLYIESASMGPIAWAPDRNVIAYASHKTLYLWDLAKNTSSALEASPEAGYQDARTSINSLAWSPDGRYVVFPCIGGLQVWDATTRTHVKTLKDDRLQNALSSRIMSVAWSPDGKRIAAGTANKETIIWYFPGGQKYTNRPFSGRGISGGCVAWSPDGNWLATVDENTVIVSPVTNLSSPYYDSTFFEGHQGSVNTLAWSPDGMYIASGSADNGDNIWVWSPFLTGGQPIPKVPPTRLGNPARNDGFTFSTHIDINETGINALAWSPNGKSLAVAAAQADLLQLDRSLLAL